MFILFSQTLCINFNLRVYFIICKKSLFSHDLLIFYQVARRSWSGNDKAEETICRIMEDNPKIKVTVPNHVQDDSLLDRALKE